MTCQCCEVGSFIVSGRLDCDHCTISGIYITRLGPSQSNILAWLVINTAGWPPSNVSVTGQGGWMARWEVRWCDITSVITTAQSSSVWDCAWSKHYIRSHCDNWPARIKPINCLLPTTGTQTHHLNTKIWQQLSPLSLPIWPLILKYFGFSRVFSSQILLQNRKQ